MPLTSLGGESAERTHSAVDELVALKPDVIFVSTNPVVLRRRWV
jgi:hypothetical protein